MAAYIGKWIYLDWTQELKAWCAAKVLAFKPGMRKHEVQYEDGEREWVDLLTKEGERAWTEEVPKKVRSFKDKQVKRLARELGVKVEMSDTLLDAAEDLLDMEDRLPNQGVKSQLPKIWENLRIQVLRCKSAKDMTAATIKFAAQMKDCVLMDDWQSKADEWKMDSKRVSSDTDVAQLVHQLKFKAVNWAQCRALFPSLEESQSQKQKPSAAPGKKRGKGAAPAVASTSPLPGIAVECNKVKGMYQPTTHMIVCLCTACQGAQPGLAPTAWEIHVGSRARNWRKSISLSDKVGKLGSWLHARRTSDPDLAFHQTSGLEPQHQHQQQQHEGDAAVPCVLPKSKVSRLGPHSAAKLREQSRPETGQLSPSKTQSSAGASRKKRMWAAAKEEEEATSNGRPQKRHAHPTPSKPLADVLRESEDAAQQTTDAVAAKDERRHHDTHAVHAHAHADADVEEEDEGQLTCVVCGSSNDSQDLLQCDGDECGKVYHAYCLDPQLFEIPEGDWFCPSCAKQAKAGTAASSVKDSTAVSNFDTPLDTSLGFFQTLFNDGPAHHPLFADTEPQEEESPGAGPLENVEEAIAAQPPRMPTVPMEDLDDDDDDDDDDALMAFMVPGSAYATKVAC